MMREILFRGQIRRKGQKVWMDGSPVDSKWVEGYGVLMGKGDFSVIYAGSSVEKFPVYTDTVGQFTGFTDMNGKKIFEGDIVESRFTKRPYLVCFGEYTYVGGYEEEENACGWYIEDENGYASTIGCPDAWATVIGNIHDNPEFLNVVCPYGERREGE